MTGPQIEDLLTWVILGVILGGRIGYVLFYQPALLPFQPRSNLCAFGRAACPFTAVRLGVIIAAFLYTGRHQIARISAGDLVALGIFPGLLLGRIANFINAELWGRPTDLPWGVAFPTQAAQYCPDVLGICARHPSQLYEAALEGLVLGAILVWLAWRRKAFKMPGLVMGTFLAGYGIARFLVEFVRQPDAQFVSNGNPLGLAWQMGSYGLTMGQILCLPMIAVGLFFILRARRAAA